MDPPKYESNFIQKHLWIPPSKRTEIFQRIYDLQRRFNVKIGFNKNQRHNLTISGAPLKVEAACTRINIYIVDIPNPSTAAPSRNNPPGNDREAFDLYRRNTDDPSDSSSPTVNGSSADSTSNVVRPSESNSSKQTFECSVCFESLSIDKNFVTCSMNSEAAASGNDETHSMCLSCIKRYAHSSITGSSIAFGGIGLKCVEPECKNAFLLSSFESYIDNLDYFPLQERLQQQCIVDANLEDLVTCSGCGLKMCVSATINNYICFCGRNNCRSCPRAFDGKHAGKTCKQLDQEEATDLSLRNLESKMSEIVIRKCHKCGINFVKADGCNKMECTCGATQCYICNKQGIKYDHFCACGNTNEQHGRCSTCRKSCRIWENFEDLDNKKINEILSSADALLEKNKQPQFNKIVTPAENPLQPPERARPIRPPRRVIPAAPPQVIPAAPRRVIPAAPHQVVPAAPPQVIPAARRRVIPAAPPQVIPAAPRRVIPAAPRRVIPAAPPQVVPAAPPQVVPTAPRPIIPVEQIVQRRNDLIVPRLVELPEALGHPQQPQVSRNGNPQQNDHQQQQFPFPFNLQFPQQWHPFPPHQMIFVPPPALVPRPEQTVQQSAVNDLDFPPLPTGHQQPMAVENLTYPPLPLPQNLHMMPPPHVPVVIFNGQQVQQPQQNGQQAQPLPQQFYYPYYLFNPYQHHGPYYNFNQFQPPPQP